MIEVVDAPSRVAGALGPLAAEDVIGVDVERADSLRYFRSAALVQVGTATRCVLLDAVAVPSMPELDALLDEHRLAVLHAAENDLVPLAGRGVHPDRMADTSVAAAVLGLPTGLDALLEQVLGIPAGADKSALQRADWEQRPLTDRMIAYAAGDVVHLPRLWEQLHLRLEESSRTEWYHQERDAAAARAVADDRDWTRVKGAARLDPRQRAILKAVWERREELAREHDIAPNVLLHDDTLVGIAEDPPHTTGALVRRATRRRGVLRPHAEALRDAVVHGREAAEEIPRPQRDQRDPEIDRRVLRELKRARSRVARELGLDPGVLCSARHLQAVLGAEVSDGAQLCAIAGLRPWQTGLLADVLWEAWTSAHSADADPED